MHGEMLDLGEIPFPALGTCQTTTKQLNFQHTKTLVIIHGFLCKNEIVQLTDTAYVSTSLLFLGALMYEPSILASCSPLLYAKRGQACWK